MLADLRTVRTHLVRLLVVALAFVLAAHVFGNNFGVPGDSSGGRHLLNYLIDAVAFGVLNMTVGVVLRLFTLPLRILSLGLFSIVINAILILIMHNLPASTYVKVDATVLGAFEAAITLAVISAAADIVEFTKHHAPGGGGRKSR